jgi:predicted ArsR family transcriptional regulator
MPIKPPPGCTLTDAQFETLGWFSTRRPVNLAYLGNKLGMSVHAVRARVQNLKSLGLIQVRGRSRNAAWLLTPEGFTTYKKEFDGRYG